MWWWNGPHPMWGMGWIFPLIGLAFMIVCLFAISRFCGGRRYNEIEDLRREMRELKDEIAELRKKE